MTTRRHWCALALAALAPRSRADGPPTVLRYGGDTDFAPFESLDAQGRPSGFQIDLLALLGPLMGVRFDIQLQPWERTESDFRSGRSDLVAMVDTAERRTWARFTRGHATAALRIYRTAERPDPHGLRDLEGLRVAVLDSDAMRDTINHWLAGLPGPYLRMTDASQALAAVRQGSADVALLPRAYADPLLASGAAPGVVAGHLSLGLQTYAFAMAPERADLQARLQAALDQLENNGQLEALRLRWLSTHRDLAERRQLEHGMTRQRLWTWGVAGSSGAALLLMGAGLWQRGRRVSAEKQRRRNAEGALKQAEELLERTFAHNPEPMLLADAATGMVRDANAAMLSLLGARAEEVLGHALTALDRHVDAAALQHLVQALTDDGALEAMPLRLRRDGAPPRDCLVSADPLMIDGQAHVFCAVRDITDQLAHDAALRAAYDALAAQLARSQTERDTARAGQARAEGALQAFTRSVAHDLRAPLNAVQGFAGLLRERLATGHVQEAAGFADHIARAAQRMNAMITALARLAQVTRQPLARQRVNMQQLAQDTWSLLAASHPERHAEFRLSDLPSTMADPDLAAQIWQNLLENASKYSARVAAPKVLVDSHRDARGRWYRVTDNGAGFDMAKADLLFQPFQRMHASSQFEGTGVGLSLVRRIVDHHGGEIRLRSAPGVGTVVEFTLDPAPEGSA